MSENRNNILLSPLDWGLGHAARCIPLIERFLGEGSKVTVFASLGICAFLMERFPELQYIEDKTKPVSYGLNGTGVFKLAAVAMRIKKQSRVDNNKCKDLCETGHYNLVVSDNRYGFRGEGVKSVLITHQLMPITPVWLRIGMPVLRRFLKKAYASFSEVWIPDFPEFPGLAGLLSHPSIKVPNAKFIGPLSRFESDRTDTVERNKKSVLIITSGPEEHRRQMAFELSGMFADLSLQIFIAGASLDNCPENVKCILSPSDELMKKLILESGFIITHSGYSTLMDLYACGRSAVIVPTRGQTEQKYLAQIHHDSFLVLHEFADLKKYQIDFSQLSEVLSKKEKNTSVSF